MGLFSYLASSDNRRNIKKLSKQADEIIALEPNYKDMTDEELRKQTEKFRERYNNGESLDSMLNEAYAVAREAAWRILKMKHFKVQIMGGIALFQGRVAEMKTGEGKTLVATLPAYLVGISGEGCHIITVNEYLAKRDAEWMGKLYAFLGLTCGVIIPQIDDFYRKKAYECDITYGTNNEFGFDYLRDNLKVRKEQKVQRELNFAIVDEVDSILIDEARTPLIISGRGTKSSDLYKKSNRFVKTLSSEDYEYDAKEKTVMLTESGSVKAEKYFNVNAIGDIENKDLLHYVQQALKAHKIFKKDNDYIVEKGEVIIVDQFTGRLMIGRRYSDGLHQAIEAKENVEIRNENKTHATITFQNYFRIYNKLSGMTGTAKTEEEEFRSIYNLDVVEIPTNLPIARKDCEDRIYRTEKGKINAITEEVANLYKQGAPVLIGTVTVEKSELLASALKKAGLPHHVLNAKKHKQEAEIIAQAGRLGAITIATNMAGRGTDILLGGNPEFMAKAKLIKQGVEEEDISLALSFGEITDEKILEIKTKYQEYYNEFKIGTDAEKEKVKAAGGLCIIGSERHESRRIDNQLRGRAGRQGDAGSSVFFISLEDDLARRFGGEKLDRLYETMNIDDNMAISIKMLSNQIEHAQKVIEGRNFSARKSLLEYDNVMNTQRKVIYEERDKVLDGKCVHEDILSFIPDEVALTLNQSIDESEPKEDWDIEKINKKIEENLLPIGTNFFNQDMVDNYKYQEVLEKLTEQTIEYYEKKVAHYTEQNLNFDAIERAIMLRTVDDKWVDHIDDMDMLRRGISLRASQRVDPVIAYKKEAFDMFEYLISRIQEDTTRVLLKAEFNIVPQVVQKEANVNSSNNGVREPIRSKKKPGRNDPCPCGSGKKYKNCCGKN